MTLLVSWLVRSGAETSAMGFPGFVQGNVVGSCYSRPLRHTTAEIWCCKRRDIVTARYCLTALQNCKLAVFNEANEIRHDISACRGAFGAEPANAEEELRGPASGRDVRRSQSVPCGPLLIQKCSL